VISASNLTESVSHLFSEGLLGYKTRTFGYSAILFYFHLIFFPSCSKGIICFPENPVFIMAETTRVN